MNVPNNEEKVSNEINKKYGLHSVPDDGSVCINEPASEEVIEQIHNEYKGVRIGDGVQEGSIICNGVDL